MFLEEEICDTLRLRTCDGVAREVRLVISLVHSCMILFEYNAPLTFLTLFETSISPVDFSILSPATPSVRCWLVCKTFCESSMRHKRRNRKIVNKRKMAMALERDSSFVLKMHSFASFTQRSMSLLINYTRRREREICQNTITQHVHFMH